jgi:hypothetical protein
VNVSTSLVDHADRQRPSASAALTKGGLVRGEVLHIDGGQAAGHRRRRTAP